MKRLTRFRLFLESENISKALSESLDGALAHSPIRAGDTVGVGMGKHAGALAYHKWGLKRQRKIYRLYRVKSLLPKRPLP